METAVAAGHPADLLALAGRDADQVIVGARGVGAPALVKMLGGVTDHVVRTAQGSVAVVPDQAEDRVQSSPLWRRRRRPRPPGMSGAGSGQPAGR